MEVKCFHHVNFVTAQILRNDPEILLALANYNQGFRLISIKTLAKIITFYSEIQKPFENN